MGNRLKRHWKILTLLLGIVFFILLFLNHAHKHGAEYVFNMKEINGVSDNNPYGIRNDLYDFIEKDMRESGITNPKAKNFVLNYVKSNLVAMKHFANKERAIEIMYQQSTIMDCLFISKNKKEREYMLSLLPTQSSKSEYDRIYLKTKDHERIDYILSSYMSGKTLNPLNRSPEGHPELCDKYDQRVLNEEEFWIKDPRIQKRNR